MSAIAKSMAAAKAPKREVVKPSTKCGDGDGQMDDGLHTPTFTSLPEDCKPFFENLGFYLGFYLGLTRG